MALGLVSANRWGERGPEDAEPLGEERLNPPWESLGNRALVFSVGSFVEGMAWSATPNRNAITLGRT